MYGNERGVGDAVRAAGLDRVGGLHHEQAEQWLPRARRCAARRSTRRSRRLGFGLRRPVPHPLAPADALRRRLRVDVEDARGVQARTAARGRSASRTSRFAHLERLAVERRTCVPAVNQVELHPYFQNAGGRRVRQARTGSRPKLGRRSRRARVLGRPRRWPRSPDATRQVGSASRPPLAHPARERRLPEVGDARADPARTSRSSTSSSSPPTSRRSTGSTAARPAATAPTLTRSLTSQVDTPCGPARVHLHPAMPARLALVLGHGAGGGVAAPDLVVVTETALAAGVTVALVEQPYRAAGRRSPSPAPRLDEAWIAVVEQLAAGPLAGPSTSSVRHKLRSTFVRTFSHGTQVRGRAHVAQ